MMNNHSASFETGLYHHIDHIGISHGANSSRCLYNMTYGKYGKHTTPQFTVATNQYTPLPNTPMGPQLH